MLEIIKKLRDQNDELTFEPQVDETVPSQLHAKLKAFFTGLFESSDFQFKLPDDFAYFIQYYGLGIVNVKGHYHCVIWDWPNIVLATEDLASGDFYLDESKQEVWLVVGEFSDKHWYYLCCDPSSKHFGAVADGEDNSPWNDYNQIDSDFKTFTAFLKSFVK